MNLEHAWPRGHLVVDDFFAAPVVDKIWREVASLERKLQPGLVRDMGHDGQSLFFESTRRKNRAVWVHEGSKSLQLFRDALWSAPLLEAYRQARAPLFQIIPNCFAPHLQISSYMTGDHYDFHEDEGAGVNLTAVVFMARNPEKVRGGDFVLAYNGEQKKIRFRHNRLVIFPSKTMHRVTPVRVASDDPADARISLQCWLAYGRAPGKTLHRKATIAKADEPTFLLAEEAIIEGAQALIASPQAGAQSPEVFYWGAFYLTRILTANLRFLLGAQKKFVGKLGPIRIRHGVGLEVYAALRGERHSANVGFVLRGAELSASEALSIFVESGRGRSRVRDERVLYSGTEATEALALLNHLLEAHARRGEAA